MGKQMGDIKKEGRGRSHKVIYELPMLKYTSFPTIATLSWHDITDGQDRRRNPHHTTAFQSLNVSKKKTQSSRTFSHFLTYLSSNKAKSRITNAKTTLVKNSEARLSFCSAKTLNSMGNAA